MTATNLADLYELPVRDWATLVNHLDAGITDPGRQPDATGPVPDIVEDDVVEVRQQPGNKITRR